MEPLFKRALIKKKRKMTEFKQYGKPLFKTVLLQVPKETEEAEDLFAEKKNTNIRPTSEVTLIEFADDCENCLYTLRGKKVLWDRMAIDIISETDEHQIVLARERSLLMEI